MSAQATKIKQYNDAKSGLKNLAKFIFVLTIMLVPMSNVKSQIVTEFTPPAAGTPAWDNSLSPNFDYTYHIRQVGIYENSVIVAIQIHALKNIKSISIDPEDGKGGRIVYGDGNHKESLSLHAGAVGDNPSSFYKFLRPIGTPSPTIMYGLKKGQKVLFWLAFSGGVLENHTIPSGVSNISIEGIEVVVNEKYCIWSSTHTIKNPRANYTSFSSENAIKQHVDANNDGICGIYEQIGDKYKTRYACVKHNGNYTLIFLSDELRRCWWQIGDIKANLLSTDSDGIFKAEWYWADKSTNEKNWTKVYVAFDGNAMYAEFDEGGNTSKKRYTYKKTYPIEKPIRTQLENVLPLLENNDYQSAVSALSQVINRINRDSQSKHTYKEEAYSAYMLRAYAYIALDLYKSALLDYDNALICKPGDEDAYYQRGRLKLELNDINGAIDDMKRGGEMGRAILREYGLLNNNSQRTNGNTPPLKKQQIPELKKQQ